MLRFVMCFFVAAGVLADLPSANAASSESHRAKRPDLFHPDSGLRIGRQRAPTPDDVPGAARVLAQQVRDLAQKGASLLDVGAAVQSRYDDLDGTWLVRGQHVTLPGAIWLPETGRGVLTPEMQEYLYSNVVALTQGDLSKPIVVFCIADCWMSWNAAQRLTTMGYTSVHWFAEGIDGWKDEGWALVPVDPIPVKVD